MRIFFIVLTSCLAWVNAVAQTTEDSVKATITNLFAGMRNADGALVKATFASDAILQTIAQDREGATVVKSVDVSAFAASVNNLKKDAADERIVFETVKTDGDLAIVWTPYRFYYEGRFHHCGVNSFQLVRLDGKWMIQYLIDTRRTTGCEP